METKKEDIFNLYVYGKGKQHYKSYAEGSIEKIIHECFLRNGSWLPLGILTVFMSSSKSEHRHAQAEHFIRACRTGKIFIAPMHLSRKAKNHVPSFMRGDFIVGSPRDQVLGNLFLNHNLLMQINQVLFERESDFSETFINAWAELFAQTWDRSKVGLYV